MSYSEVLETRGGYRVRLALDEDAQEPDDDGQSPLLRIDPGRLCTVTAHVSPGSRPHDLDERVEQAAAHLFDTYRQAKAQEILGRWLRAYLGVTATEWYWSDSYWYVTYDSADWRAWAGAPEGSVDMSDYRAWVNGEVYGYVIEKQITWRAVNPVTDDPAYAEYPDRVTWEEIEDGGSSWGYYGHEWAEQAAREAFEAELPGGSANPGGITLSSPEVPEIGPRVRDAFDNAVTEVSGLIDGNPWRNDLTEDDINHDTIREQAGKGA